MGKTTEEFLEMARSDEDFDALLKAVLDEASNIEISDFTHYKKQITHLHAIELGLINKLLMQSDIDKASLETHLGKLDRIIIATYMLAYPSKLNDTPLSFKKHNFESYTYAMEELIKLRKIRADDDLHMNASQLHNHSLDINSINGQEIKSTPFLDHIHLYEKALSYIKIGEYRSAMLALSIKPDLEKYEEEELELRMYDYIHDKNLELVEKTIKNLDLLNYTSRVEINIDSRDLN